jgi:hypothetical protein
MFMERDDIMNLFVVTNLPMPSPAWLMDDEPPLKRKPTTGVKLGTGRQSIIGN